MNSHLNQVSQLLHAASGLRLLAKGSPAEQSNKLKNKADAVEKMANELAVKASGKHSYSPRALESALNRERRNAQAFSIEGAFKAEDLPGIVQSFMTEVKSMESENNRNADIVADLLK